ncbi:MAG: hypothetical protein MJ126_04560 [Lachnospiraceae bacterium]|nr:hypothetical protein [Lachnospiraceae bacterium]
MHYKTGDKVVAICDEPVRSDSFAYPPKGTVGKVISIDNTAARLDICVDWIEYEYECNEKTASWTWVNSDEIELVEPEREHFNETYEDWVSRIYHEFMKNEDIKLHTCLIEGKFVLINFITEKVEFGSCGKYEIKPEDVVKPYAKLMGYEIRNPHEKIKDLKPGDTFELISGIPYKLIKFDKIEGAEMAVVKSLETNKYYLQSIETNIYNVKEN